MKSSRPQRDSLSYLIDIFFAHTHTYLVDVVGVPKGLKFSHLLNLVSSVLKWLAAASIFFSFCGVSYACVCVGLDEERCAVRTSILARYSILIFVHLNLLDG